MGHPVIFPLALVERHIQIFTTDENKMIFDPFVGIGNTVLAAKRAVKTGIGFELNPEFAEKATRRCEQPTLLDTKEGKARISIENALNMEIF